MIATDMLSALRCEIVVKRWLGRRRARRYGPSPAHPPADRQEVNDIVQNTDQRLRESLVRSVDELQRLPYNVVTFSDDMRRRNRDIKDFLYARLYRHYRVMRMAVKAENIIRKLFEAYQSEPSMLPHHVQGQIPEKGLERTICDYLAGMTDRYAVDEYAKLFDPSRLP
jgi:dGTPase